ncbi:hypothetical protein SUGI_0861330 [Cryptomeria japonica]|nr:hypothetical protein SUGI_0861330 [Cryptomeria japonica]
MGALKSVKTRSYQRVLLLSFLCPLGVDNIASATASLSSFPFLLSKPGVLICKQKELPIASIVHIIPTFQEHQSPTDITFWYWG